MQSNAVSRRFVLKTLGMVPLLGVPKLLRAVPQQEHKLNLHNIHTGEWYKETVWTANSYVQENLVSLNHFLRDWRTNDAHDTDLKLVDLMLKMAQELPSKTHFEIVCGYRSPKTNALLRKTKRGVAKNSLHCQGKAIDFSCQGVSLKNLRNLAKSKKMGGVGYYPQSGFIHIDSRETPYYW